ncbi:MAG: Flp pilus assembly complex ATPase component TadA [Xanthomonadaceae bacterium]|nr:Flp pilus assembly complex ATPase component TadA [Xanthomonadaceae bacterium]
MSFRVWLQTANTLGASDLHLETDTPVLARVREELVQIADSASDSEIERAAKELVRDAGWTQVEQHGSTDHSTTYAGIRCRVNVYRTVRGTALAVRLLATTIKDLRNCNLHPDLADLIDAKTGLVIVSGPTGSGKSTTLAALIEEMNSTRARHIIALDSPIEYLYSNRRSFIRQREIPTHSPSFEQAIVDALRENPDVLVIGEMRTPEVMRLTLNAAETGHLVITTMHSATCAEALTRLCMSFPSEIQGSIRGQIADCLVGVVCQRLDYLSAYGLRVPRCEILRASSASRGTIRSGQFGQIATVIQSGGEDGMWSFDRYDRWIRQKTDWVLPTKAPASSTDGSRIASTPLPQTARQKDAHAPVEIAIDEELDLQQIAKQIDDGKY